MIILIYNSVGLLSEVSNGVRTMTFAAANTRVPHLTCYSHACQYHIKYPVIFAVFRVICNPYNTTIQCVDTLAQTDIATQLPIVQRLLHGTNIQAIFLCPSYTFDVC